jgi:hypothetical protein
MTVPTAEKTPAVMMRIIPVRTEESVPYNFDQSDFRPMRAPACGKNP